MKLTISILLCMAASCLGQAISLSGKSTLTGNSTLTAPAVAAPSVSTFFTENFEGPGHQDSSFSSTSGTINDSYTTAPAPLQGTYSLSIAVASSYIKYIWGATHTEVDYAFYYNAASQPSGSPDNIVTINDSGGTGQAYLYHRQTTGILQIIIGGASFQTAAGMSTATTYKIWVHVKTDGTGDIEWEPIGTGRLGSQGGANNNYVAVTGGTPWSNMQQFVIRNDQSINMIFDHVLISDGSGRYGDTW